MALSSAGGLDNFGQSTPPDGQFVSVSAGLAHSCGVKTSGHIECWGSNVDTEGDHLGQATPHGGQFISVSGGGGHSCGVRTDGSVECWGDDSHGQSTPPDGRFTSVTAGMAHSCGVTTGGAVECWGNNNLGQSTPPGGQFISVSTGFAHSCGVTTGGAVECWGSNVDFDANHLGQSRPPDGSFGPVSATESRETTPTPTATATATPTPAPQPTATATPTPTPEPTAQSMADLVESVRPGVVLIVGRSSSGSGFVLDSAGGLILTNEHVIRGQNRLTVVLDDGARTISRVLASDDDADVALLEVTTKRNLTALPFAAAVREGEEVIALGYPYGPELGEDVTISRGIVSALRTYSGIDYVQTDAAINPGNSGGPLLNVRGEVVGMNTAGFREAEGINFAISFKSLASIAAAMKTEAEMTRKATPTPTSQNQLRPRERRDRS